MYNNKFSRVRLFKGMTSLELVSGWGCFGNAKTKAEVGLEIRRQKCATAMLYALKKLTAFQSKTYA